MKRVTITKKDVQSILEDVKNAPLHKLVLENIIDRVESGYYGTKNRVQLLQSLWKLQKLIKPL